MMVGTTDESEWDRRHVICTGRKSLLRKEVSMLGKRDLYLLPWNMAPIADWDVWGKVLSLDTGLHGKA